MRIGAGDIRNPQRRRARRPEQEFQRGLIETLRMVLIPRDTLVFAVPNGGARTPVEAAILIGQGVVRGIPDVMVLWRDPQGIGRALGLECKAPGGARSDAQVRVHEKLSTIGVPVATVETIGEALDFCRNHNVPVRIAGD